MSNKIRQQIKQKINICDMLIICNVKLVVDNYNKISPSFFVIFRVSTSLKNEDNSLVIIHSDGTVKWKYPRIQKSFCKLRLRDFPWDHQICKFKFGSWIYDGTKLDIMNISTSADVSMFQSNGEWDMIKMPVKKHVVYYGCCPEPYPDLTFWLIIQRRPLYYMFNLVMPNIFISITTILVFCLPPESGEKLTLSVTVLLSSTVFLLLVAESLPSQSESIPILGVYL